ncbi:PLP-dependent aminotransferase family protein [Kitasatospora camelliae]|uniref:PLP-dependent aminotransferase family protein n=1 Tax=Kitasatospora camelliae TaxID=3156397 RepID=A0AAU8JRP9_9ACTN
MDDYRLIADELAAAITDGRLRPGEQLPTQRAFAHRRGIAASTAGRVYRELTRRGLVVGEVGRGTFVRAGRGTPGTAVPLAEPARAPVDLELNYPVVPEQSALLAEGLAPLLRPDVLAAALRPIGAEGTAEAREAFAALAAGTDRPAAHGHTAGKPTVNGPAGLDWRPSPDAVLFAGNGRQAVAAALAALVPPGQRLGVEELTYPVVKALAGRLGITLVPLPVDRHGLLPDTLAAAQRGGPLRALYLQPRVHNPLGGTLPPDRRAHLAAELRRLDLPVVEDAIWSFLRPDTPPLAAELPERTVLVDSLSKRLAPGLTAGFAVVPDPLRPALAAALRSGGWAPSGFALESAVRWITDGTLATVAAAKRTDAAQRQQVARRLLTHGRLSADPGSYYLWWELPAAWRAETFIAASARAGIAVTPGAAFAVGSRTSPAAVRVGLASPSIPVLTRALGTLADLARAAPEDVLD